MEFGRVEPGQLAAIDFHLPSDDEETARVLKKSNLEKNKQEVFVGCAKWGRKDWVGKIYPAKTKEADFLRHYALHFNCIELNATFYRMPTHAQTAAWRSKVGKDFKFCPKFTDQLTHLNKLKNVHELADRFLDGISGFEKNLGPVFLLPHPSTGPKDFEILQEFIQSLPKDLDLFVELRHAEWFSDKRFFNEAFTMFEKNKTGAIITDASGRRDCVHMRLTKPEAFIRFVGNGLIPSDYTRIDDWVMRIKSWLAQGIEKIYFFMHQHEELHSPELCRYVIQQINKHCGLSISEPRFLAEQHTLFL